MLTIDVLLLGLAGLFGLYLAWNIGANDVANAMGTSVGSHALSIRRAVLVAAIFEFAGAFLVGGEVTDTIRKGILSPELFEHEPRELALGMLAALLSSALWLHLASWRGLPVSTTHSIVGGVIGFGVTSRGFGAIDWAPLGSIVASWVVSPLLGGLIAFATFALIRRYLLDATQPLRNTRRLTPWLLFVVGVVLSLTLFFKGLKNLQFALDLRETILLALCGGCLFSSGTAFLLRALRDEDDPSLAEAKGRVERIFAWLQVVTACLMAFAHGSNDVANAVGPVAAVLSVVRTGVVSSHTLVPSWVLAAGGFGIVLGLATYGARVIETVGRRITDMTPTRGFAAEFGAATTVLIGSRLGMPLSTTHVLIGAIIGVGFARGLFALDFSVLRSVASSWFLTVPLTGGMAATCFTLLRATLL